MTRSLKPIKKIRKPDLVKTLAHMEGMSISQANRVIEIIFNQMLLKLQEGVCIDIYGFGQFYGVYVPSRRGSHPVNQEQIEIDETVRLKFEAAADVKRALKEVTKEFKEWQEEWAEFRKTNAHKASALRRYHEESNKRDGKK